MWDISFFADSRCLAIECSGRTVRVRDVESGTELKVIEGANSAAAIAGAPEAPFCTTTSGERALEMAIENCATGRQLAFQPVTRHFFVTDHSGRCWAGTTPGWIYIFTLEGVVDPCEE